MPLFRPTPLVCRQRLWHSILLDLRKRGLGHRESGGFLLGRRTENSRSIEAFIPYDAIDPNALQGYIVFDGSKMDQVWQECRKLGLQVVADVHTHPSGFVGQSNMDQENPMLPERGHIAIIIPNFAAQLSMPGEIGIYEYRGRDGWADHSAKATKFFKIKGGFLW